MIRIKKNKIRRYYYIGSVLSIILLAVLPSFIFRQSLTQEHKNNIDQLSASIIQEKKKFMRNAVDQVFYMIETEITQVKKETASKKITKKQFDAICVERISNRIRGIRLIDEGYVWVNRIFNYKGGDNYAVRLIHPNPPDSEGLLLSTNMTDIKGNRPYEEELNGINEYGEIFFEYYFKKLNSEKISRKMSFAKLYKPYDWIVATGVYLDDIDKLIRLESKKMQDAHNSILLYLLLVVVLSILIAGVILKTFEKQIDNLIRSYEKDIDDYTETLIEEKEKTEQALAEVSTLKGIIPICSYCHKIRDDEGAWDRMEKYISSHSMAQFSHGVCPECEIKARADAGLDKT